MKNKKLLFVVSNPSQFKGFFRNKLKKINENIDIYLLIYPYGFLNQELKSEIKNWTKILKKKSIIKNAWYLSSYSYKSINENIKFNIELLKIIKKINYLNFDFILIGTLGHYWEKIIVKYFKEKKIIGYLLSPPSGMDFFNSLNDFTKSIRHKKFIFNNGKYIVKSDNIHIHKINTENNDLEKKIPILSFILDKIKVRTNLLINLFIIPIYLKFLTIKMTDFNDQINFNFDGVNKLICFHPSLINIIKKLYSNKKILCYSLANNRIKNLKKNEWIYLLSNNSNKSLKVFYQIIINLKKINKISKIYIKQHPSWLSEGFNQEFYKKLREIKIPFMVLNKSENVVYEKYQGIILEPGGSIIEGLTHNTNLKILAIKSNYIDISGAQYEYYKKIKDICWNHDVESLKKYLKKKNIFNQKNIHKFKLKELNS